MTIRCLEHPAAYLVSLRLPTEIVTVVDDLERIVHQRERTVVLSSRRGHQRGPEELRSECASRQARPDE